MTKSKKLALRIPADRNVFTVNVYLPLYISQEAFKPT